MSPKGKAATPYQSSTTRRGLTALGGAALATLGWAGIILLGLPALTGNLGTGGFLVAAVAGAVLGLTPLRHLLWVYAGLVMTLLLLVGYTPIFVHPILAWPRRDIVALPPDAVVVLSGRVSSDSLIDPEATDRLLAGLFRAKQWHRPLVISTVVLQYAAGAVATTSDQRRLISLAGDSLVVLTVDSVHNTHDEAVAVATLAAQRGWRSVAVVTAPMHSRRACATFEHTGLQVACLPSESRGIELSALLEPGDRLRAFGAWVYERLGWIEYRWRGWI